MLTAIIKSSATSIIGAMPLPIRETTLLFLMDETKAIAKNTKVTIHEFTSPKAGTTPISYVSEAVRGMAIHGPIHKHIADRNIKVHFRPRGLTIPSEPSPIFAIAQMMKSPMPISTKRKHKKPTNQLSPDCQPR